MQDTIKILGGTFELSLHNYINAITERYISSPQTIGDLARFSNSIIITYETSGYNSSILAEICLFVKGFTSDLNILQDSIYLQKALERLHYFHQIKAAKTVKILNYFKVDKVNYVRRVLNKVVFPPATMPDLQRANVLDVSQGKYLADDKPFILEQLIKHQFLTIHAPTGAGKTTLISDLLKEHFNAVLIIEPTSTLNMELYLDSRFNIKGVKNYICMGKSNKAKKVKNLTKETQSKLNFIDTASELLEVIAKADATHKVFITMDLFHYNYLFNTDGTFKKALELVSKTLIVVDEYHKIIERVEDDSFDNSLIGKQNPFHIGTSKVNYLYLTATPLRDNKATNVIHYEGAKTNLKKIVPCTQNGLLQKLEECIKEGKYNILYYSQNVNHISHFEELAQKYYNQSKGINNRVSFHDNMVVPVATCHRHSNSLELFDNLISRPAFSQHFCLLGTSSMTQGKSVSQDIDYFFIDCTLLTSELDLIQILGRPRKTAKEVWVTVKQKEKEITDDEPVYNIVDATIKANTYNFGLGSLNIEDTKTPIQGKGFMLVTKLQEFLNAYHIKTTMDTEIAKGLKFKLETADRKECLLRAVKESPLETFDFSALKTFKWLDASYFTPASLFRRRITKDFFITKDDLLYAIEQDYIIDFKHPPTLKKLIKYLSAFPDEGYTETSLKKVLKLTEDGDERLFKYILEQYYKTNLHDRKYYRKTTAEINSKLLTPLKLTPTKKQGKLNQHLISDAPTRYPNYIQIRDLENIKSYDYSVLNYDNGKGVYTCVKNKLFSTEKKAPQSIEDLKPYIKYVGKFCIPIVIDFLASAEVFSLDVETKRNNKPLDFYTKPTKGEIKRAEKGALLQPAYSYVSNFNMYNGKQMLSIELDEFKNVEVLNSLLNLIKNKIIIIHNTDLEFKFFSLCEGFKSFFANNKIEDTLIEDLMLKFNKSSSLKALAFNWFAEMYDEKGDYYNPLYMFKDVYYTYHLFSTLQGNLKDKDTHTLYKTVIRAMYHLTKYKQTVEIDEETLKFNLKNLEEGRQELEKKANSYLTPTLLKQYIKAKYNFILMNTKKAYLKEVLYLYPQYKELSIFLDLKIINDLIIDNRRLNLKGLRPSYNLALKTGRISTQNPNIQGFKKSVIEINGVELKGSKKLLKNNFECDYSQLEMCVASELYELKGTGQAINKGQDLHSLTASKLQTNYNYEYILEQNQRKDKGQTYDKNALVFRNYAKIFNFGLLYGMTIHGLNALLLPINKNLTPLDVQTMYDNYTAQDEDMNELLKEKDEINLSKYVNLLQINKFGRKRVHCKLFDGYKQLNRQIINYTVQSSASDLTVTALVKMCDAHPDLCIKTIIHDAIYTDKGTDLQIVQQFMISVAEEHFTKVKIKA